jgi:DNA/RNA-binding domain of Phe-tRNA-synthetase-like protein
MLELPSHPLVAVEAFATEFPEAVGALHSPEWLLSLMDAGANAPLSSDDAVRSAIRDLLRHGGYKPTGRGKPASEYLLKAVTEKTLGSINAAVDACNAVSFHSGLPISVIDLDKASKPFRLGVGAAGESYVFNASEQTIDLSGLLCLYDANGPCANAVKDSQRTKTHAETRRTLSVVWGSKALGDRTARTARWYREILERLGGRISTLA